MKAGSLIADHAVVSNQTNSQPNVIAAVDNLVKGATTVTILGVSAGATSASIISGTKIAIVDQSTTACSSFNQVFDCPTNQECAINSVNGVPYCAPLQRTDFLAYGSTVSDTQLSGDDRSSPRLRCFTTIPFLGTTHSYLRFSTNGLACLGWSPYQTQSYLRE